MTGLVIRVPLPSSPFFESVFLGLSGVVMRRAITGKLTLSWVACSGCGFYRGNVSGGCVGVLAWEAQTPSAGVYKVVHRLFKVRGG